MRIVQREFAHDDAASDQIAEDGTALVDGQDVELAVEAHVHVHVVQVADDDGGHDGGEEVHKRIRKGVRAKATDSVEEELGRAGQHADASATQNRADQQVAAGVKLLGQESFASVQALEIIDFLVLVPHEQLDQNAVRWPLDVRQIDWR